jgi:ABC-type Fe3+/spermidine/putrescine transport system ATPase subunit
MIEFRHVNKIYDDKVKVVDDISLDIKQGEFVVLIGPSGCGKSTVLEMMTGIEKPTRGSIYLMPRTLPQEFHDSYVNRPPLCRYLLH